jgi:hypothetical protein
MPEPILSASVEEPRPLPDVEKVEKSSVTKTRQIAIRCNIAAQHHLRPVAGLARCPIDKLAGPPADFLNAVLVGLPENRAFPKGSFSTQSDPEQPQQNAAHDTLLLSDRDRARSVDWLGHRFLASFRAKLPGVL